MTRDTLRNETQSNESLDCVLRAQERKPSSSRTGAGETSDGHDGRKNDSDSSELSEASRGTGVAVESFEAPGDSNRH